MLGNKTNVHRCASCGCSLEGSNPVDLCLPCLVAQARRKMGATPHLFVRDADRAKNLSPTGLDPIALNSRAATQPRNPQARPPSTSKNTGKRTKKNKQVGGAKKRKATTCLLCGKTVAPGKLLAHKQEVHGESIHSQMKRATHRPKSIWVSIVSGGLPGLGKRK